MGKKSREKSAIDQLLASIGTEPPDGPGVPRERGLSEQSTCRECFSHFLPRIHAGRRTKRCEECIAKARAALKAKGVDWDLHFLGLSKEDGPGWREFYLEVRELIIQSGDTYWLRPGSDIDHLRAFVEQAGGSAEAEEVLDRIDDPSDCSPADLLDAFKRARAILKESGAPVFYGAEWDSWALRRREINATGCNAISKAFELLCQYVASQPPSMVRDAHSRQLQELRGFLFSPEASI